MWTALPAILLSFAMATVPGAFAMPQLPFVQNPLPVQVPIGPNPAQAAISPDGSQVWVTDASSDQIYVIDTASLAVDRTINLPATPYGIAFLPNGSDVWVSARYPNLAIEVSASQYSVVATVSIPVAHAYPYMIAVSPNGTQVWVSDYYNNITIINARTAMIVTEFLVLPPGASGGTTAMSFSPDGRVVYLGFTGLQFPSNVIVAYNATSRNAVWSSTIDCAGSVGGIVESPDEKSVYVLNDSTPGAEFNVLGASQGSIVARIPMPTIRIEDFSTMAVADGGAAVWFAGSQPGNDGVLVGVDVKTDSLAIVDYDPAVNGSTSLILAKDSGAAYVLADGGSPYLLAWTTLPNIATERCLLAGPGMRGCDEPVSSGPITDVTPGGPLVAKPTSTVSTDCVSASASEELVINAVIVGAIAIAAVVSVSRQRGASPPRSTGSDV